MNKTAASLFRPRGSALSALPFPMATEESPVRDATTTYSWCFSWAASTEATWPSSSIKMPISTNIGSTLSVRTRLSTEDYRSRTIQKVVTIASECVAPTTAIIRGRTVTTMGRGHARVSAKKFSSKSSLDQFGADSYWCRPGYHRWRKEQSLLNPYRYRRHDCDSDSGPQWNHDKKNEGSMICESCHGKRKRLAALPNENGYCYILYKTKSPIQWLNCDEGKISIGYYQKRCCSKCETKMAASYRNDKKEEKSVPHATTRHFLRRNRQQIIVAVAARPSLLQDGLATRREDSFATLATRKRVIRRERQRFIVAASARPRPLRDGLATRREECSG